MLQEDFVQLCDIMYTKSNDNDMLTSRYVVQRKFCKVVCKVKGTTKMDWFWLALLYVSCMYLDLEKTI